MQGQPGGEVLPVLVSAQVRLGSEPFAVAAAAAAGAAPSEAMIAAARIAAVVLRHTEGAHIGGYPGPA